MNSDKVVPKDIDEYIAGYPEPIREILQKFRAAIRAAAPDAVETISYQMPAFKQNGILVYFAAHTNHLGFYPASTGISAFKKTLSDYAGSKGTVRFPYDKPIPYEIVTEVVKYRVLENLSKPKRR
jgi:uncharacterized protein YdhG (YjbR/CyaY superfamily)